GGRQRFRDQAHEISDVLEPHAPQHGGLSDGTSQPLEWRGELFQNEGRSRGEDDLVPLFGRQRLPVGNFGGDISLQKVPQFGKQKASFFQLRFQQRQYLPQMGIGAPKVPHLRIPKSKYRRIGQNLI